MAYDLISLYHEIKYRNPSADYLRTLGSEIQGSDMYLLNFETNSENNITSSGSSDLKGRVPSV